MSKKFRINLSKGIQSTFLFIGLHQDRPLTYQTEIASEMGKAITTINYHITKLEQKGLIDNKLKLTEEGIKAFKFLWKNIDKKALRAHNIQVIFKLDKCPKKFPECFSKSIYSPFTNKKYKGLKTNLNGFKIMFYNSGKIVCVVPDIYGDTDEEISSIMLIIIPDLIKVLEEEFIGIRISDYELCKLQTMHIAVLDAYTAKKYLLKGFTKENKDYAIDNSHGIPEIELTNPSQALRDIMDLLGIDNYLRKKEDGNRNKGRNIKGNAGNND
jgi:predicted transcriptional regulator